MSIRKNLFLLKVYYALRSMLFVLPIITVYYEMQKNVGIDGVFYAEAAFSLVVVCMIVPAGYLSDVWRRKNVLMIGAASSAIGFVFQWLGHGVWQMIMAEMVIGIGFALISSTMSAMAYDTLLSEGREKENLSLQSDLHIVHAIAGAFSAVFGAYLYKIDPDLPVQVTIVICLLGVVAAKLMDEPEIEREKSDVHPLTDMKQTMKYAFHGHKEVACIILLCVVVLNATRLGYWMQQPYYTAVSVPVEYFGILMALGAGASTVGAFLAKREGGMSPKFTVISMILLPVLAYGSAALLANQKGLVLIVLGAFTYGFAKPVIDNAINSRVESKRRATIMSAMNLMMNFAFIVTAPILGWSIDNNGVMNSMQFFAVSVLMLGAFAYVCLKRHKVV